MRSYYLICLHEPCSQEAADFIAASLVKNRVDGGADLEVVQEKLVNSGGGGLILHVGATNERLLEAAEEMGLKKTDIDGVTREFQRSDAASFRRDGGFVECLTVAEVHKCVIHAIESVHFDDDQKELPGHSDKRVMKQAPVLSSYQEAGLCDSFPLHDDEELNKLRAYWKTAPLFKPPIQEIRDYFGENVALYVSFTAFYTKFLGPMAGIGFLHFVLDRFLRIDFLYSNVLFAFINLIAVTVFLEMWKRKSAEHSHNFGTGGKLRQKRPRPAFRGEWGLNPATGREEIQYPYEKTMNKLLFVSLPVTLVCLIIAFLLMLASFEVEKVVMEYARDPLTGEISSDLHIQLLLYLPSTVYSVIVIVMNLKYLSLAHMLTENENHRTQEQFERHVVAKLILFEFVNTFLALFYIAFVLKDVTMLKSQLFTMLIVMQLVNQVQESVLPILIRKPSARRVLNKIAKKAVVAGEKVNLDLLKSRCCHSEVNSIACLEPTDAQVAHAQLSLRKDPFESTYDDFMEIWLQFGHVFLFSSVYPLAAFFALANNLVELRLDSYKLCKLMRKPTPRGVRDIGSWYMAFSVTSIVAVVTNCALLYLDADIRMLAAPSASDTDWLLLFVAIEHVFLALKVILAEAIPDVPKHVKLAMDRNDHLLKNRLSKK